MRTPKNTLEVDIDATAHDLEECTRDYVNKFADDQVNTLVQAAEMSAKHRECKKKKRNKPNNNVVQQRLLYRKKRSKIVT